MRSHILDLEQLYCSQGDNSGKHQPKRYFQRGKGSFLYDGRGTPFLDFQMFNSAANFGYQNSHHKEAVVRQLNLLPSLASEFMHEQRVLVAAKIAQSVHDGFGLEGKVHFSVGGAQAIDDALKVVSRNKQTTAAFAFEGAYHGRTIAVSSLSSSARYRRGIPTPNNVHRIPFPYCSRCAYDKSLPECDYYCESHFARLFDTEHYGVWDSSIERCNLGAFFAEPILGRGGYVIPPPDYFRRLRRTLDRREILLVMDEVQMGFYRTGKLWASEHFDVSPDIVVFGKSITNGLSPLSGFWARSDLIDDGQWPPGSSHATYSAHPIGTAAACATFEVIAQHDLEAITNRAGGLVLTILEELNEEFGVFSRIDALGLAFGVELCIPGSNQPNPELAKTIVDLGLGGEVEIGGRPYGLVVGKGGYFDHVLMLSPSLFISDSEISLFGELIRKLATMALSRA